MPRSPNKPSSSRSADKYRQHQRSRRSRSPSRKLSSTTTKKTSRKPTGSSRERRSPSKRSSSKHHRSTNRSRRDDSSARAQHQKSRDDATSSSSRRRRRDSSSSSSSSQSSSLRSASSSSSPSSTSGKSRSRTRSPRRSKTPTSRSNKAAFIPLQTKDSKRCPKAADVTFTSVQEMHAIPILPETINQINCNEFVAKTFTSTSTTGGTKKQLTSEKVMIDLDAETVTVPQHEHVEVVDTVFNPNLYGDDAARMDKWVKKLFHYRQKAFLGSKDYVNVQV